MKTQDFLKQISNWNVEEIKEFAAALSDRYSELVEDLCIRTEKNGIEHIIYILTRWNKAELSLQEKLIKESDKALLKELKDSLFIALQAVCLMNDLNIYTIQKECDIYLSQQGKAEDLINFLGTIKALRKHTKELKKTFLNAYRLGGVVHNCIDYIRNKYDLGLTINETPLSMEWQKFYDVTLPEIIKNQKLLFDDYDIYYLDSPLIDEIKKDLEKITDLDKKELYVYNLLTPFKEISDKLNPIAAIERLDKDIQKLEMYKEFWRKPPPNKPLIDANNKRHSDPQTQIEACETMSKWRKRDKERIIYISTRFREIINQEKSDKNSVEDCFIFFFRVAIKFWERIDALLLENGLDLVQLQRNCGVYIFNYRTKGYRGLYLGTEELEEYLEKLSKERETTKTPNSFILPAELNTERATKAYNLAIKEGLMYEIPTGYHWNKTNALLAYFTEKIYCPNNIEKYPETALGKLFNVQRLSKAVDQIHNGKNPPRGSKIIDKIIASL